MIGEIEWKVQNGPVTSNGVLPSILCLRTVNLSVRASYKCNYR